MYVETQPVRDEFAFSLDGMAVINSFVFPPAVSHHGINRAWDSRLGGAGGSPGRRARHDKARRIESFLARYFAPGSCCCDAT